jgi:hypothetical protein
LADFITIIAESNFQYRQWRMRDWGMFEWSVAALGIMATLMMYGTQIGPKQAVSHINPTKVHFQ